MLECWSKKFEPTLWLNNKKISNTQQRLPEGCNCRDDPCPLSGTCNTKNIVYSASLINNNDDKFVYKGITCRKFIEPFRLHKRSFKNRNQKGESALSKQLWKEKDSGGAPPTVELFIQKLTNSYKPGDKRCNLCIEEVIAILDFEENNIILLNSKEKFFFQNVGIGLGGRLLHSFLPS